MATPYLVFLPGELIRWQSSCGTAFLGRFISVYEANVRVSRWVIDNTGTVTESYHLPVMILDEHIIDTIPRPSLSSLVFVHHADDFINFKVKFIHGWQMYFAQEIMLIFGYTSTIIKCDIV
jgi:hypothetical protein